MSLCVNSVGMSNYSVPFRGSKKEPVLVETRRLGDSEEKIYETEGSTGKKWGVGLASAFIPGLGQAINGDWGKAVLYFLGASVAAVGAQVMGIFSVMDGVMDGNISKTKAGIGLALGLSCLGIGIASIVDAVKNAKSKVSQIVAAKQDE